MITHYYALSLFYQAKTSYHRTTYPATLVNNPASEAILKVFERVPLDLLGNGRTHSGTLDGDLGEPEHASHLLPAHLRAQPLTHHLLERAVTRIVHQLLHQLRRRLLQRNCEQLIH